MAKKTTIDLIIKAFRELGGNVSDVLGTRTNISFLGVGDNVEPFLDKNLNTEALGVLSQSKAVDEVKNSVGFAVGNKLNDIQANNLLTNLNKMKEFYMPAPVTNITDLATGTRNLDAEGLGALRQKPFLDEASNIANRDSEAMIKAGLDPSNPNDTIKAMQSGIISSSDDVVKQLEGVDPRDTILPSSIIDDLPPPGSRGGPDDIAAPFQDAEETIKQLRIQDPDLADQVKKMMDKGIMSTVTNRGDMPAKRVSAREFLVEALKKDEYDIGTAAFGKTNLNNIISAEDVRYITEGGGGIGGDPIVLVEKYFGPKIAEMIPSGASNEEIMIFTKRVLENVEDAAGLKPDNPRFDRFTARFVDEMADGGRVGLRFGKLAGKAFGLAKKTAAINKSVDEGTQMGYGALRKYGLEAKDISRLFRELAMDRTMVGPEKTQYFKMLNQVLKNPDDFPDGIIEIKKRLGMDFARGGLAKILEV